MDSGRALNAGYGLARIGFGIFASSAPTRMGRTWVGGDAERPGATVILRALGLRDIALGSGTLAAALRGDASDWLAVSMISDLGDAAATLIGRNEIGSRGVAITAGVAGAGALGAALLLAAERSRA
ncbi:MAG: hypothetical protein J0H98_06030 [Solirubrobacterales bacterium]|nr:hypothetical protein [Solirubrobacterales bacterium]